jgi:hypothetical protein
MRSTLLLASLGAQLAACASARGPASPPEGTYRFTERVAQASSDLTIEGELHLRRDTIQLDYQRGICRYDAQSSNGLRIMYRCGEAVFSIDRRDPLNRTTYAVPVTVLVPVRSCVRYTTTADGRSVCAQWQTVNEERRVLRTGFLRPQLVT